MSPPHPRHPSLPAHDRCMEIGHVSVGTNTMATERIAAAAAAAFFSGLFLGGSIRRPDRIVPPPSTPVLRNAHTRIKLMKGSVRLRQPQHLPWARHLQANEQPHLQSCPGGLRGNKRACCCCCYCCYYAVLRWCKSSVASSCASLACLASSCNFVCFHCVPNGAVYDWCTRADAAPSAPRESQR